MTDSHTGPSLLSGLVGVYAGREDWRHWEMHPEGEGVWRRALAPEHSRLLAITYGAGSQHRPISA